MTISDIFEQLKKQCDLSLHIIEKVNNTTYLADDDSKAIRDIVVIQAFISVFTEWEHFLEKSTIAYSLGEKDLRGNSLIKYIEPQNEEHANQLIKGTSTYPDWSKIDVVIDLEKALFKDGAPYKAALQGFSSKYKEIKKLRNHIVHNSVKSSDEFDSLVRTSLSASKVGISPSDFLLSKKGNNPFFYEIYIKHIYNAAKMISGYIEK